MCLNQVEKSHDYRVGFDDGVFVAEVSAFLTKLFHELDRCAVEDKAAVIMKIWATAGQMGDLEAYEKSMARHFATAHPDLIFHMIEMVGVLVKKLEAQAHARGAEFEAGLVTVGYEQLDEVLRALNEARRNSAPPASHENASDEWIRKHEPAYWAAKTLVEILRDGKKGPKLPQRRIKQSRQMP
jgi:hypothetical protein